MATTTIVTGHDRLPALMSLMTGDEKHDRSATSTLDVLWVLYDRFLDIDPDRPEDPDRDRFLLSKGHGPMAYYAVLTAKGLRSKYAVIVGGAAPTPEFSAKIGVDAQGHTAAEAVRICRELMAARQGA